MRAILKRKRLAQLPEFVALLFAVVFVGARWSWLDALVIATVVICVKHSTRKLLAVASVVLFAAAFPPLSWPTYFFCLPPLIVLWGKRHLIHSRHRIALEATLVGFSMCWFSTAFVRSALTSWGGTLHAVCCLVFSIHILGIAASLRLTRDKPYLLAVVTTTTVAVAGEMLQAWLGVTWSVTNLALAAGDSPVAQWATILTPFGVSAALYLVNFSFVRSDCHTLPRRIAGLVVAFTLAAGLWVGGKMLGESAPTDPIAFSAMLVQPHVSREHHAASRPWTILDPLTESSLRSSGPVDLIVWPETCLSESRRSERSVLENDFPSRLRIQDFAQIAQDKYRTNCIAGVVVAEQGLSTRHGLDILETRRFNCACLASTSGKITYHEKIALVPLREGIPRSLDYSWMRSMLLPMFNLRAPISHGRNFGVFQFRDSKEVLRTVAVSICYESFLPWLPQYNDPNIDAIVHLVYDGDTVHDLGLIQRHILACRYRAIETRKWNLVCSTWTGTSIISPAGSIVAQLPATAGVLRTDLPRACSDSPAE